MGSELSPWFIGSHYTFANASVWDHSSPVDVIVVGVPLGSGPSHEAPGMQLLRKETSRIPAYSPLYGASIQDFIVADGQDLVVNSGASMDPLKSLAIAAEPFFRTGKPV